jgi:hypothetical protein
MINDVSALREITDGWHGCGQRLRDLMYAKDATPRTTRRDVRYDDVVGVV